MKYFYIVNIIFLLHIWSPVKGQDLRQSQVPSIIINKFHNDFPDAKDIEWKKKGENYKVEFEIGYLGKDHDITYSPIADVLRHKKEISKSELPAAVKETINKEFPRYLVKDVEQIEYPDRTIYSLEVKSFRDEWDIKIDAEGKILKQKRD